MTKYFHFFTLAFVALFAFQMTAYAQVPTEEEEQDRQVIEEEGDILSSIEQEQELSLFAEALRQSGVAEELTAEGPFTVFAPNDEAFEEKLNGMEREDRERPPYDDAQEQDQRQDRPQQERYDDKFQDMEREDLAQLVRTHIVMGEVRSADLQPGTELQTLEGTMLTVRESDEAEMRDDEPYDQQQQEHEPQERQERQHQDHAFADVQIENAQILRGDIEADNGVIHIIDQVLDVVVAEEPVTGEEN